ncbi:MAG: polyprenyl synthetase family protein [Bacteroidales bacterium]|nr:polyprenyl synthetase family protein [Bacteroidales bacterium]
MESLDSIKEYLSEDWKKFSRKLEMSLQSGISLLDYTNRSILSSPGKQLRPVVALLVSRACSSVPGNEACEDAVNNAVAGELLHNATLLHDDVADRSPLRRGKPTVNALLGPSASVLVGDFWLSMAVNCVMGIADFSSVVRNYTKTLTDLSAGEMFQLEKAGSGDTTVDDYYRIIYGKTASLFETICSVAAVCSGASDDVTAAMGSYGRSLGMAFQIRDDIFDYSPGMDIGKPVGADLLEKKITLPLLEAFGAAGKEKENAIREKLMRIDGNPAIREEISAFVHQWQGPLLAQRALEREVESAVSALNVLVPSKEKDYLALIATFVARREK